MLAARVEYLRAYSVAWTVTKDKGTSHAFATAAFSQTLKEEWDKRMQKEAPRFTQFWEKRLTKATQEKEPYGLPWWLSVSRLLEQRRESSS